MERAVTAPRRAAPGIVTYRLGGRDYPLRSVATCKVCNSEARLDVERALAAGATYASIAAKTDGAVTAQNVRNHFVGGHMPMEVEALRRLLERRAEEVGRDIEAGVEDLVDHVALARTVVRKAFEGVASGELRVSASDGLAAARLLYQDGDGEVEEDKAAWVEAFMIYQDTARAMMGAEMFDEFGRALARNPVLRALVERHRAREVEPAMKEA